VEATAPRIDPNLPADVRPVRVCRLPGEAPLFPGKHKPLTTRGFKQAIAISENIKSPSFSDRKA